MTTYIIVSQALEADRSPWPFVIGIAAGLIALAVVIYKETRA